MQEVRDLVELGPDERKCLPRECTTSLADEFLKHVSRVLAVDHEPMAEQRHCVLLLPRPRAC
jgi:hypothetical protein